MAAIHGRKGKVIIGTGTTQVLSVYAFSYDASADQVDVTAMGDTSKSYLTGLADGSGTIEARLNATDFATTDGQGAMYAAFAAGSQVELDLILDSDVTTGEFVGLSGSTAVINNFSINQSFDDSVSVSFGFQGTLVPYSG